MAFSFQIKVFFKFKLTLGERDIEKENDFQESEEETDLLRIQGVWKKSYENYHPKQKIFINALIERLNLEQKHRMRTEEQSAVVIEELGKTIGRLVSQ